MNFCEYYIILKYQIQPLKYFLFDRLYLIPNTSDVCFGIGIVFSSFQTFKGTPSFKIHTVVKNIKNLIYTVSFFLNATKMHSTVKNYDFVPLPLP